MSKFKVGDKVFDLRYGIGEIAREREYIIVEFSDKAFSDAQYKLSGNYCNDKNPLLWTLQEARDRGYGDQLAEEPFRWKGTGRIGNQWRTEGPTGDFSFMVGCEEMNSIAHMLGKKGTLTFVEDVE